MECSHGNLVHMLSNYKNDIKSLYHNHFIAVNFHALGNLFKLQLLIKSKFIYELIKSM